MQHPCFLQVSPSTMQRCPCWFRSPHRPERCKIITLLAPLTCSGLAPKAAPSGTDKEGGLSCLSHSCAQPASSALKPSCGAWDTSPDFLLWSHFCSELFSLLERVNFSLFCPESSLIPSLYLRPALHTEVLGEGSCCQSIKGSFTIPY